MLGAAKISPHEVHPKKNKPESKRGEVPGRSRVKAGVIKCVQGHSAGLTREKHKIIPDLFIRQMFKRWSAQLVLTSIRFQPDHILVDWPKKDRTKQ